MTDSVIAFLDAAAADRRIDLHSLIVRDPSGMQVEAYWAPYTTTDRQLVYSVSKTFTATAAGFALAEGLLHLDDLVVDLIEPPFPVDGRRREITVHHLLSMTTGHDVDTLDFTPGGVRDIGPQFWGTDPQTPVGSRHVYNNGASWALGEVVRTVTGQHLVDYLRPRLLEPLGADITWDTDPYDRELGFSGVHLTTSTLAAVGQLYASQGRWQGRQVLPVGWTDLVGTRHTATNEPNPEWNHGYGYQVWMGREGFRLDGAYGQYAFVLPESETVIAIMSAQGVDSQPLIDLVWQHLVPGLGDAPSAERAERVAALSLRTPRDSGAYGSWVHSGPVPTNPTFVIGMDQFHLPLISDLAVTRDDAGFTIGLTLEDSPVTLTTTGDWRRQVVVSPSGTVPVAVAAGVTSRGGVRVLVCATETPHVLVIDANENGASMAWRTTPLHMGRFGELAAR